MLIWLRRTVVVLLLAIAITSCSSTPDTPANVVMTYLVNEQMEKPGADRQLCKELRDQLDTGDGDKVAGYRTVVDGAGGVFENGPTMSSGETATVPLIVQTTPTRDSRNGDPWVANVVKEGGSWKLCGFSRS